MTTPLRVGLVMPTYFEAGSVLAGGERYAYELARALAPLTPTTLFTFAPVARKVSIGDLTIDYGRIVSSRAGSLNPIAWSHLRGLSKCDVIHCLQPRTYVTDLAMLVGKMLGKRTFLTDLSGAQAKSLARFIPMRNLMTGFLPISEYNRQQNADITRPVTVIGGGVDTDAFSPDPSVPRARDLFCYVGRIFEGKGLHLLIEALPPGARLDVIGGFSDDDYRSRVEKMAAGKAVRFLGKLSDADVVAKYRESLASVLPSLVDTGFTSSMESMACGAPVIGTRLGSLPEVIAEGRTGLLIPPNDVGALRSALGRALAHPDVLAEMAGECRTEALARFTWTTVAERCLRAYRG
ncbi:MAG: glycosyltransferase family 1 protein [Acidobacteria bacterium]|nr:MAG: glycosyltransferase family 1 protein [Acidobacteriota bacterium]